MTLIVGRSSLRLVGRGKYRGALVGRPGMRRVRYPGTTVRGLGGGIEVHLHIHADSKGRMNYPTNLMIPFFKGKIGKDMETGLTNLKGILERQ